MKFWEKILEDIVEKNRGKKLCKKILWNNCGRICKKLCKNNCWIIVGKIIKNVCMYKKLWEKLWNNKL